jgi:RNA polymerase sigma-70 factor (ECF subfamily)
MSFGGKLENLRMKSVFHGPSSVFENEMSTAAVSRAHVFPADLAKAENSQIAEGLRRHDPELLDRLIVQYQHRLMRYLLFLTGSRETAEDIFQETWMRVLTRGGQYTGAARFDTWLFTIGRNLLIDLRRKRTMVSLDAMCEVDGEDRPLDPASAEPNPFQHYQGQENARKLTAALLTLDPLHREVLVLRFYEELSLDEIAQVTRAPLSTIKSRLYRGLAALKPRVAAPKGAL